MMHTTTRPGEPERIFQGRASRVYDRVARHLVRRVYRRIAEDIADAAPDGADLLDVGTGPGLLLVEAGRLRPDIHLTGVDLSEDMAALARRNLRPYGDRASAHVGDVTRLPFPDDSFDLIVASFTLHHWAEPAAAVPELARVLRPGGRIYLYDMRFAPFAEIDTAARETGLLTGRPYRRTLIRAGTAPLPWFVRHVMSAPTR